MTEKEWLTCDDSARVWQWLFDVTGSSPGGRGGYNRWPSDRKARLFAVACMRQVWSLLTDPRSRLAVEVAERYADGEATARELVAARGAARAAALALARDTTRGPVRNAAWHAAFAAQTKSWDAAQDAAWYDGQACARKRQAHLLRDLVGNPWRPVTLLQPQPWIVTNLARAAYDERQPDGLLDPVRLAILAAALEEAGCPDGDLLEHLRSPGPHVRGCWALDLILGKE